MSFSHEKLNVYQKSLEFIEFVNNLFSSYSIKLSPFDQLDRAATSIPLNIAEGTGKYTSKDKCRYYDIARGSALECAACLDVLSKREKITKETSEKGKNLLFEIVSMLTGLIRSTSDRVYEPELDYKIGNDDND
ncbi:MAG: four helix bundle protein [Ignavibacteriaceae bacterium]